MNIKINKKGFLEIERAKEFKETECPFTYGDEDFKSSKKQNALSLMVMKILENTRLVVTGVPYSENQPKKYIITIA